ncbi:hypothetical protein Tco_0497147 [Tanacetum coccineum]
MQQPMQNPKDISDPTTAFDMALKLVSKIQDRQMLMVDDNVRNQFKENAVQNVGHLVEQNAQQAEGNSNEINGNQIRSYNYRGEGHYANNCTVKPRKRDVAYLQTQLQIAQKDEAEIQLNYKEFDYMAVEGAYNEIEKVTANCNLQDNLQQASTLGTQSDKAPVYYLDRSAENNSNVISAVLSVEQSGGTVEQRPANVEETRALYDSLYNNLAIDVEKVNSVNRKLRETNVDLTTELARYKNQEKCFEISQEKHDKLERCYQKSVYQEQCLTKKINALHLSSGKQITTLNEEISNLNKQLSKEKSIVSSLPEEKKRLKSDFKIRKDELLDKQIQLENKIKELDNILVKMGQSIQTMHMLSPKPDSFYHTKQKMALGYQNPFYLKQAQQKQQKFSDDTTPSVARKFLNVVKSTIVTLQRVVKQKITLDIHNWSSSSHQEIHKIVKDEIFPIVKQVDARVQNFEIQFLKEAAKFVRDFKSIAKEADESIAKQKALELEIEHLLRAVVSQDIMSIVQCNYVVDTSNLQTELERTKERFENCIIKKENEYAKLWNDWYKKCKECKYDKISYDRAYNDMQQKIERLQAQLGDLKGKSKDTPCVSNTLDPLSQKLENENVELEFQILNYAKENAYLNTTYKNMFDSISVIRTQTKTIIDSLQNKLHDTIYENAKLRAQLFDKVSEQKDTTYGTSMNTKFAKQSILRKPPSSSRPKLYAVTPLPKSKAIPKIDESHALSKPVTSNSVPTPTESKVMKNDNVISLGIFRINPFKASSVDNFVPNKHVKESVRTKPITVSQPHVVTKEDVNSNRNGFSPNNIESTTRTRRPQPRYNPKNDKVLFKSKSSCL